MGNSNSHLEQFYDLRERDDSDTSVPAVYIASINQNRFRTCLRSRLDCHFLSFWGQYHAMLEASTRKNGASLRLTWIIQTGS